MKQISIDHICVGDTYYPLMSGLAQGRVTSIGNRKFEFHVDNIVSKVVGAGTSQSEAIQDWKFRFHSLFQELHGLRRVHMTEEQHKIWQSLISFIDVNLYKENNPVEESKIGFVSRARPWPEQIQWVDGSKDRISPTIAPANYASLKPGQWIKAVYHRDPVSKEVVKVLTVSKTKSARKLTSQELAFFIGNAESSKELPPAKIL